MKPLLVLSPTKTHEHPADYNVSGAKTIGIIVEF